VVVALGIAMAIGAAALFARLPIIQTRLVTGSPVDARGVVLALNGSMVFLGQGLGAAIGGATIATAGLAFVGYAAAAVSVAGAVFALAGATRARRVKAS